MNSVGPRDHKLAVPGASSDIVEDNVLLNAVELDLVGERDGLGNVEGLGGVGHIVLHDIWESLRELAHYGRVVCGACGRGHVCGRGLGLDSLAGRVGLGGDGRCAQMNGGPLFLGRIGSILDDGFGDHKVIQSGHMLIGSRFSTCGVADGGHLSACARLVGHHGRGRRQSGDDACEARQYEQKVVAMHFGYCFGMMFKCSKKAVWRWWRPKLGDDFKKVVQT